MPEIQDMSLRYDGTVYVLEIAVNTSTAPDKIMRRVRNAIRGPAKDACLISLTGYAGDAGREIWAEAQKVAKEISANLGLRYGGNVYLVEPEV